MPSDINLFGNHEVILVFGILLFGFLILAGLSFMAIKKSISEDKFTILSVVVLVIVAALFMLIAGFSSERTTPLITLLGAIIGYVLGNKSAKS